MALSSRSFQASSAVFSFFCARRQRAGFSGVTSGSLAFRCAPDVRVVIISRHGSSGGGVGSELPQDEVQSNSPR